MSEVYNDCRIGATVNFLIRAGETWQLRMKMRDAANSPIPLAGFVIGPFVMYDRLGNELFTVATEEIEIEDTDAIINKLTPDDLKKTGSNYFNCPFLPPGGGPKAIITGKVKVEAHARN